MPEFINSQELLYANQLVTGQLTCYVIGDDGDRQKGQSKIYQVLTTGSQSGTVNVDSPHYAAATIAFAATTPGTITDSANLLATVLTGDKIRVRGSALNDNGGVEYNVSTGGVAGTIRTTEATVAELAGAYITICKRATHSNAIVVDLRSDPRFGRRMWTQSVQTGKIGPASDGKLNWYNATKCYTLHPAAADLQMIAATKTLKIVGGAGEIARYFAGMVIVNSGFAVACNNLPGYVVQSVTVNNLDLDLVLGIGLPDQTMTGTTTNGNKVISGLLSTSGLYIGMAITGTGVGTASVIASIDSATQITGSVNSTATGTVSVSFRALADEAAGVNGVIKIVCQNIYGYCAAANVALLGGYGDWRVAQTGEQLSLYNWGYNGNLLPDTVAFPDFPSDVWSSTTHKADTTQAWQGFSTTYGGPPCNVAKTTTGYVLLVRGG